MGTPFCLQLPDLGQAHISDFTSRKLVLSSSTTLLLYVKPSLINIFPTDIHCIKEQETSVFKAQLSSVKCIYRNSLFSDSLSHGLSAFEP